MFRAATSTTLAKAALSLLVVGFGATSQVEQGRISAPVAHAQNQWGCEQLDRALRDNRLRQADTFQFDDDGASPTSAPKRKNVVHFWARPKFRIKTGSPTNSWNFLNGRPGASGGPELGFTSGQGRYHLWGKLTVGDIVLSEGSGGDEEVETIKKEKITKVVAKFVDNNKPNSRQDLGVFIQVTFKNKDGRDETVGISGAANLLEKTRLKRNTLKANWVSGAPVEQLPKGYTYINCFLNINLEKKKQPQKQEENAGDAAGGSQNSSSRGESPNGNNSTLENVSTSSDANKRSSASVRVAPANRGSRIELGKLYARLGYLDYGSFGKDVDSGTLLKLRTQLQNDQIVNRTFSSLASLSLNPDNPDQAEIRREVADIFKSSVIRAYALQRMLRAYGFSEAQCGALDGQFGDRTEDCTRKLAGKYFGGRLRWLARSGQPKPSLKALDWLVSAAQRRPPDGSAYVAPTPPAPQYKDIRVTLGDRNAQYGDDTKDLAPGEIIGKLRLRFDKNPDTITSGGEAGKERVIRVPVAAKFVEVCFLGEGGLVDQTVPPTELQGYAECKSYSTSQGQIIHPVQSKLAPLRLEAVDERGQPIEVGAGEELNIGRLVKPFDRPTAEPRLTFPVTWRSVDVSYDGSDVFEPVRRAAVRIDYDQARGERIIRVTLKRRLVTVDISLRNCMGDPFDALADNVIVEVQTPEGSYPALRRPGNTWAAEIAPPRSGDYYEVRVDFGWRGGRAIDRNPIVEGPDKAPRLTAIVRPQGARTGLAFAPVVKVTRNEQPYTGVFDTALLDYVEPVSGNTCREVKDARVQLRKSATSGVLEVLPPEYVPGFPVKLKLSAGSLRGQHTFASLPASTTPKITLESNKPLLLVNVLPGEGTADREIVAAEKRGANIRFAYVPGDLARLGKGIYGSGDPYQHAVFDVIGLQDGQIAKLRCIGQGARPEWGNRNVDRCLGDWAQDAFISNSKPDLTQLVDYALLEADQAGVSTAADRRAVVVSFNFGVWLSGVSPQKLIRTAKRLKANRVSMVVGLLINPYDANGDPVSLDGSASYQSDVLTDPTRDPQRPWPENLSTLWEQEDYGNWLQIVRLDLGRLQPDSKEIADQMRGMVEQQIGGAQE